MTTRRRAGIRTAILIIVFAVFAVVLGLRPRPTWADNGQLILVNMGDSYAAGNGAPDIPLSVTGPAGWVDAPCSRSNSGGAAQAYYQVIKPAYANADFFNVACSNATVNNGVLGAQVDGSHVIKDTSQVQQVESWMALNHPGQTIDALVISIGGNDVGFAPALIQCLGDNPLVPPRLPLPFIFVAKFTPISDECSTHQAFTDWVANNLAGLDGVYEQLFNYIKWHLHPRQVFITQYPDSTHDSLGTTCAGQPSYDLLGNISWYEAQWVANNFLGGPNGLNAKIAAFASRHAAEGWHVVDGIAAGLPQNGYCASDPWVNTFTASMSVKGDPWGMVHPNVKGYAVYRDRILGALNTWVLPPRVPSALRLAGTTPTSIQIAWNDNSGIEDRYEVQETAAGDAPSSTHLPANSITWTHTGVSVGSTYTYQVRACNAHGCSFWTDGLRVAFTAPAAPTSLRIVWIGGSLDGYQALQWNDNSTNEDRFELKYRQAGSSTWNTRTLPPNTTRFVPDTAFSSGATYSVYILACNGVGCSAASNTVSLQLL